MNLLFKISYGLYVAAAGADGRDSGCIINTLMQQTATPERFTVTINKANYTTELIKKSGKLSVALLSKDTTFAFIKALGMQSGRDVNKFEGMACERGDNGVLVPTENVIGYFEMQVEDAVDMGTHIQFLLSVTAIKNIADREPLTYAYYQSDIKPKPQVNAEANKEKWVCKICGYVHEGPLPSDFVCPLCKHPASDFEKLG